MPWLISSVFYIYDFMNCFYHLVQIFFIFQKFFSPEEIENPQLVLIVGCAGEIFLIQYSGMLKSERVRISYDPL